MNNQVYKYDVKVYWIHKDNVKLIETMLQYDLWKPAELKWKKPPMMIETSFQLSGPKLMTKAVADEGREKYKTQWSKDGHQVEKVTFQRVEDL